MNDATGFRAGTRGGGNAAAGTGWREGRLTEQNARVLVRLSAALAGGDDGELRAALRTASATVPVTAVEEALLQSYLFLGFPAALSGLATWREVSGNPPEQDGFADGPTEWATRGEDVCRIVYGRAYEKLRGNVRRVHPALDRWMIVEGYGKVLGRPGLDLGTRETCIVAILAATAREPQLHSHLRGALHAGAPPARVQYALEQGLRCTRDAGWAARVGALWERVRDRVDRTPRGEGQV